MRILWISHSHPPQHRPDSNVGGMQRVAEELSESLGKRADVTVHRRVLRGSSKMMRLKTGPFLARLLWEIPRTVRADRIEVVVFSSMVGGTLAVPLRRKLESLGADTAVIAHGHDVTLPFAPYQRLVPRILAAVTGVIAVSRATGTACVERGLPPAKLQIVPNGVSVPRFEHLADRALARRQVEEWLGGPKLAGNALVLCSVGRHIARKGFGWFVREVMPKLPNDVHYWVAGDGPESSNIRRAGARAGLESRVQLVGRLTERQLMTLFRSADLLVQPNIAVPGDLEGFGIVMLEAGMCGLPTVAANIDGIPDVVTDGQNGYLVESGNVAAFADRIGSLRDYRATDPDLRQRATRHTRERFAWPLIADRFVRALRKLRGGSVIPEVQPMTGVGA